MPLIGGLYLVQLTLTSKGLSDVPLVGGLCHVQWTLTTKGLNDLPLVGGLCLMQWTLTTKGPNDLPLVGGLCLVQRTSTTKGLNDLPLIGGLCLVQQTSTAMASMICPSSEDFVSYQWRTLTMIGQKLQTGTSQRKQQRRQGIKRMHYLDEGGRICIGRLVNARIITALGWGWRLNPKSLWACSNNDMQQGLGIVGPSAWTW